MTDVDQVTHEAAHHRPSEAEQKGGQHIGLLACSEAILVDQSAESIPPANTALQERPRQE